MAESYELVRSFKAQRAKAMFLEADNHDDYDGSSSGMSHSYRRSQDRQRRKLGRNDRDQYDSNRELFSIHDYALFNGTFADESSVY